jgi:hypothetical protein
VIHLWELLLAGFFRCPPIRQYSRWVVAARDGSQTHLAFTVQTADGNPIPAQGGVRINDYSAELGPEGIELEVLGIGYPLYEELFPGRLAEYRAGWRKTE